MVKEEKDSSSNRPDNTAFTQQRLPAWQPILSAGIIIPGFVLIGLAFIGVGVALFIASRNIQVLEVRRAFTWLRIKIQMSQGTSKAEKEKLLSELKWTS